MHRRPVDSVAGKCKINRMHVLQELRDDEEGGRTARAKRAPKGDETLTLCVIAEAVQLQVGLWLAYREREAERFQFLYFGFRHRCF